MNTLKHWLMVGALALNTMAVPAAMADSTGVDLTVVNPRVDANMRLLFSARNLGTDAVALAAGSKVYYYVSFKDVATGTLVSYYYKGVAAESLIGGAQVTTTLMLLNTGYNLKLEDGHEYEVSIKADWGSNKKKQNLVTESNETNNEATPLTFTFNAPDVSVTEANAALEDENLVVTYTLSNDSVTSVAPGLGFDTVTLNGVLLDTTAWSTSSDMKTGLKAGGSELITYTVDPSVELDFEAVNTFTICSDTTESVQESDETNNCTEAELLPSTTATATDTDGDGLSNDDETTLYGTDPSLSDTDGDGLTDYQEVVLYGTKAVGYRSTDSDWDLLTDYEEVIVYGTDPNDADTDDDGRTDKIETAFTSSSIYYSNPLDADTDDDGLLDGEEDDYGTHSNETDTDGDNYSDGDEVHLYGTNPDKADSDSDGLNDNQEIEIIGTNPMVADTDGNGVKDGAEDADSDGLSNAKELKTSVGTNSMDSDTDDDGLNDGDELNTYKSDPLDSDSDDDGLNDGDEVNVYGTELDGEDSDYDGLTDGEEVHSYGTSPTSADTDGDTWGDGDEIFGYATDPLDATSTPDSDGDGYPDVDEIAYGANPNDSSSIPDFVTDEDGDGLTSGEEYYYGTSDLLADTDGDGVSDLDEVMAGTDPLNA